MYRDTPCFIYSFTLHLNSLERLVLVSHKVKRRVLSYGVQYYKPLLEHIELSLQNTQVALVFGVMHTRW